MTSTPESVLADDAPSWAVRLEAKIDVALIQHSASITTLHERVETIGRVAESLDGRLDQIERSNFITPKSLAAAIVTTLTGVAAFIALIDRLQM